MPDPGILADLLFALVVFGAILALFTDYAEPVLAATLLAVVWQFVAFFGASLFLATVLISIVAALRAIVMIVGADIESPALARFLDELLTDDDRERDTERLDTDVDSIDDYRR